MRKSLSEIFLDTLNEDYSDASVEAAFIKCDQILKEKLETVHSEEEYVAYFFDCEEEDITINGKGLELFDFWDVFKEFSEILQRVDFGPELIILKTIAEVDFLNKSILNNSVKKSISDTYVNTISQVVKFINELTGKKQITITILAGDATQYEKVIPLEDLEDEKDLFTQVFLENVVMDLVNKLGLIEIELEKGEKVYIAFKEDNWRILKKLD
ncbi:hypothetical protein [Hespellia stercorisuis]|uniref:Uncharacterized protein n=1 Tax=Hespellia stercorisuis DSM 15480 TaxID=1121950 RepID=A0A1M6VM31_9FIRM|nr:hypothetical protein [Hespellia stercorisuis]SHK82550.1 hypothetical protein SAMN02745243_03805 [Hespellia stercorisuis DSM 15480]